MYTEVLGRELHRLQHGQIGGPGLESKGKATNKVLAFVKEVVAGDPGEVYMCNELLLAGGGKAARHDVVLLKAASLECGRALLIFSTSAGTFAVVSMYSLQWFDEKALCAKFDDSGESQVVPCEDILEALTYSSLKSGIRTLIPYHHLSERGKLVSISLPCISPQPV